MDAVQERSNDPSAQFAGLVQALIGEGVPESDARKIASVVLAHVAERHSEGKGGHVAVRCVRGATHRWWRNLAATIAGGTAASILMVPIILQLDQSGFGSAAAVLGLVGGVITALAGWRLKSLRRPAESNVTIEIIETGTRQPLHDSADTGTELESRDVGTFASAVGRITDRNDHKYAVG